MTLPIAVEEKGTKQADDALLETARKHHKIAVDGWKEIYDDALDDLFFSYDVGEGQWPENIKKDRKDRPTLTINKVLKFIRSVRGDARQNRPRVKVIPVDNQADPLTADLINGLIRQIEYQSSAEVAYDTAYMNAVSCSIGYARLTTEYLDPMSFEQDILIKRIKNPFTVHFDPSADEFDLSDAEYCFISERITEDDFKAQYPKASPVSFEGDETGTSKEGWFADKLVKVAEYFYKEHETKRIGLVEFSVGGEGEVPRKVTSTMELTEETRAKIKGLKGEIKQERDTVVTTVKWMKMNGNEILERGEWAGKFIPIIPFMGDEITVDGKKYILSLIRGAKDPQRMYNYWSSAATEGVALSPKAPFIVASKQIGPFKGEWENANRENKSYLPYKHVPGLPKPSREAPPQVQTGIVSMMQNTSFELEDQLGKYESSKGAPSNERSGIAIDKRVAQSDKGTFTFVDNYSRAIIYLGKQLVDLIPKIYDTERAVRIKGEAGNDETQVVNQNTGLPDRNGNPLKRNDLSVGKFDLIAVAGPSFSSRRQEALSMLVQTMQFAPSVAPFLAPMIFEFSDWPEADSIAKKIKQAVKDSQDAEKDETQQ